MDICARREYSWAEVCQAIRAEIGEASFTSWVEPLRFKDRSGDTVTLIAPNRFHRTSVESHYTSRIRDLWSAMDTSVHKIVVEVGVATIAPTVGGRAGTVGYETAIRVAAGGQRLRSNAPSAAAPAASVSVASRPVERSKTFESFKVGRSNDMAYAAALAFAERLATRGAEDEAAAAPLARLEPRRLAIYGSTGVGKTHLLHAVVQRVQELKPSLRIMHLTAEAFLSGFLSAMRAKWTQDFKHAVRDVDLLLIDDIAHICGNKVSTHQELSLCLDALEDVGASVMVASNVAPSNLGELSRELYSRLIGFMAIEIHPAERELRRKILEGMFEEAQSAMPSLVVEPAAVDFLARRLGGDARAFEGALASLVAAASFDRRPVTVDLVERILSDFLRETDRKLSMDRILRATCKFYQIDLDLVLSPRRTQHVAHARHVGMYLCRELTPKPYPEIARKFCRKDHTTVMHAVRKLDRLVRTDDEVAREVEAIRRQLESGADGAA